MSDVTQILSRIDAGDPTAAEELLPLVYDQLRKLAAQKLAQEKPGQTLQATALVHEAYLRLVTSRQSSDSESSEGAVGPVVDETHWESRRHFFAAAGEAMRRILVENARRKGRKKRGGHAVRVELREADLLTTVPDDELLALDEALREFADEAPEKADLVKLRFFAGLTLEQAADSLGISRTTASRYWAYARAWLYERLRDREKSR